MAPTAATRARSNKPKPEPVEAPDEAPTDPTLSNVTDEKTGKQLTIQQLKNKLRNEAEREVLDTHKDEVVKITQAKYDAHGLEYVRRLTEEEKAAKAIEEYYVKFPSLRPQVQQQQAQQQEGGYPRAAVDANGDAVRYVEAVPGGALATFRAGDHEVREVEEGEPYVGYAEYEHGQPDGTQ